MTHVYMQQEMHSPTGGKYLQHKEALTERAKRAESVFISSETHFEGASEASELFLALKSQLLRSERSEPSFFLFAINIHYFFIIEI